MHRVYDYARKSEYVKRAARGALNRGVYYVIDVRPENNSNMISIKTNLKNAYNAYKNHDPKNFNKGQKVGIKLSNSLFKLYDKQANKHKYSQNTPFMKGVKNGVRQRVLYWVPGVYARSVKRKFEYDTSRFMKRAGRVKGVENVWRLFSNNNKNNGNRSRKTNGNNRKI
jgi:hypothetical protein